MSFLMHIDERSAIAARFIHAVHTTIQKAFIKASKEGLTQQALAEKIGVNRSTVNRRLQGLENLTLRSVADLAWALGCEPDFRLLEASHFADGNEPPTEAAKPASKAPANASSGAILLSVRPAPKSLVDLELTN